MATAVESPTERSPKGIGALGAAFLGLGAMVGAGTFALLATSSSVNANVYAAGNITSMLARTRQFPALFGRSTRLGVPSGLVISAALVL